MGRWFEENLLGLSFDPEIRQENIKPLRHPQIPPWRGNLPFTLPVVKGALDGMGERNEEWRTTKKPHLHIGNGAFVSFIYGTVYGTLSRMEV